MLYWLCSVFGPCFRQNIQLTPWSRVLQKLLVTQLVTNFPTFYGTRSSITVSRRVRHWPLSWTSCIRFTHSHRISPRSILILSSHPRLRLPSGLLPSRFTTEILYAFYPHACYMPPLILTDLIFLIIYGEAYKLRNSSLCSVLHYHTTSSLLGLHILLVSLFSDTVNFCSSLGKRNCSVPNYWYSWFIVSLGLTKHHDMKTYWGSGGTAPHILWPRHQMGVVSFTARLLYPQGKSPWYPLDRRLGGPQSRSGRAGGEKNSPHPPPPPQIEPENPDRPARSPALYWLSYQGSYLLYRTSLIKL
jgi:hypothetical protein